MFNLTGLKLLKCLYLFLAAVNKSTNCLPWTRSGVTTKQLAMFRPEYLRKDNPKPIPSI